MVTDSPPPSCSAAKYSNNKKLAAKFGLQVGYLDSLRFVGTELNFFWPDIPCPHTHCLIPNNLAKNVCVACGCYSLLIEFRPKWFFLKKTKNCMRQWVILSRDGWLAPGDLSLLLTWRLTFLPSGQSQAVLLRVPHRTPGPESTGCARLVPHSPLCHPHFFKDLERFEKQSFCDGKSQGSWVYAVSVLCDRKKAKGELCGYVSSILGSWLEARELPNEKKHRGAYLVFISIGENLIGDT